LAGDAPDQVHAGNQVAPLVAAADLQRAAVPAVQLEEVVRLQDLVAELGVADPAGLEPGPYRLPGEHLAQREVLADVAQKRQRGELLCPLQIADHERGRVTRLEVQEAADLIPDVADPSGDNLRRVEHPLRGLAARIPDEAGRAAHQANWPVSCQLE